MPPIEPIFKLKLEERRPDIVGGSAEERTVDITWQDGHESKYGWEALRWACPCALCRGEGGQPGMLHIIKKLRKDQTELVDMGPVGDYAMNLRWADGHETGIYTWEYLRTICPCSECDQRRRTANAEQ